MIKQICALNFCLIIFILTIPLLYDFINIKLKVDVIVVWDDILVYSLYLALLLLEHAGMRLVGDAARFGRYCRFVRLIKVWIC